MKKQNHVVFFNILSTLLLRGITIFTAPVFARLLSDSSYGVIRIYTIWVSVAAIAFSLQSGSTLVNARAEYPEADQKKYQSSVMFLSLAAYGLCSGLVLLFLGPVSELLQLPKLVVALLLVNGFGSFCLNFLNAKFTYEFQADKNMFLSLGVTALTFLLSIALILPMDPQIRHYGRIIALALTYGGLGLLGSLWILGQGRTFYKKEYWSLCLSLALPLVFYNLSDLILGQTDQLMLQRMVDEGAVGQYGMALTFAGILFTIYGALDNSWKPFYFEDQRLGNREGMVTQAGHYLELFTVLSMGFVLLTPEVYGIFVGGNFRQGTLLVPVFAASYYLNFLCTFPVNYETYRKKTRAVAVVTIGSSLVNIALNYLLIQVWGALGAALATALSHGIQLLCHYVYTRYFLGKGEYAFRLSLWGPYALVFAGAAAVSVLAPWQLRWPLGAALGVWELLQIRKRKVLI